MPNDIFLLDVLSTVAVIGRIFLRATSHATCGQSCAVSVQLNCCLFSKVRDLSPHVLWV